MTTTTTTRSPAATAFTLAEVMIGSTIASFVLLGVLSTFVMLGRSGVNVAAYATMDAQTRKALEEFAQDVRMASGIVWNGSTSVTLTVPDNYTATANLVTYAWDDASTSTTYRYFYRKPGNAAASDPTLNRKTTFVANVTQFIYNRYDRLNAVATTDADTKRIQINMTVATTNRTVVTATDTTLSASFILRNKTTN
jgi:Tfp pilus assembly protein PilW